MYITIILNISHTTLKYKYQNYFIYNTMTYYNKTYNGIKKKSDIIKNINYLTILCMIQRYKKDTFYYKYKYCNYYMYNTMI